MLSSDLHTALQRHKNREGSVLIWLLSWYLFCGHNITIIEQVAKYLKQWNMQFNIARCIDLMVLDFIQFGV